MKYIKYFENEKFVLEDNETELYSCEDFCITDNLGVGEAAGVKGFINEEHSCSATFVLIEYVKKNSKYLNDEKLRKISIEKKDIDWSRSILRLYKDKLENINFFRSAEFNDFFISNDKKYLNNIPDEVYMDLVLVYYPIIENIIKTSKNLGELIDKYRELSKDFIEYFDLQLITIKYNI
jgi:hypothetical protein